MTDCVDPIRPTMSAAESVQLDEKHLTPAEVEMFCKLRGSRFSSAVTFQTQDGYVIDGNEMNRLIKYFEENE